MLNAPPGEDTLGGPSSLNKSTYQNQPAQLSPAKDGPMCQAPSARCMRIIVRWGEERADGRSTEPGRGSEATRPLARARRWI